MEPSPAQPCESNPSPPVVTMLFAVGARDRIESTLLDTTLLSNSERGFLRTVLRFHDILESQISGDSAIGSGCNLVAAAVRGAVVHSEPEVLVPVVPSTTRRGGQLEHPKTKKL